MGKLEGRIALVTGSSRGIGRGIALAFAAEGAHVAVNYLQAYGQAKEVVSAIEQMGNEAIVVQADVAEADQARRLVHAVQDHFGRLDILVNNAGGGGNVPFLEISIEAWDAMIAKNLRSAFLCTRFALDGMLEQRFGRIINISSQLAIKGGQELAHYCAAKGGLIAFTKALALEVAGTGVTVNAILITWATATQAAAAGGVTTILEMPSSEPPASTPDVIRRRRESGEQECYVDFALYGGGGSEDPDVIAGMAAEGVIGFKIITLGLPSGHKADLRGLYVPDNGALYRALKAIVQTGLPCAIHAEDNALVEARIAELKAAGRTDPLAHLESRPPFVEAAAVSTLLCLVEALGVRLHLPHTSSAWAMRLAGEGKRRGLPLTIETCPHYLLFDAWDMERVGVFAKINPPLRSPEDSLALWTAVRDGTVDTVGSDHGPYRPEEKAQSDIWLTPPGHPGVEVLGHSILGEALAGRISLSRAVEVLAEAPARIFGLAPRKGRVAVGADADLVVYDPTEVWTFHKEEQFSLARDNYYLYDKRQFKGRIRRTIVRGQTVYADGSILGRPGHGRFVRPVEADKKSQ